MLKQRVFDIRFKAFDCLPPNEGQQFIKLTFKVNAAGEAEADRTNEKPTEKGSAFRVPQVGTWERLLDAVAHSCFAINSCDAHLTF